MSVLLHFVAKVSNNHVSFAQLRVYQTFLHPQRVGEIWMKINTTRAVNIADDNLVSSVPSPNNWFVQQVTLVNGPKDIDQWEEWKQSHT